MTAPLLLEIAIESPAGALRAEAAGANRIELCANLALGGTSPSLACLEYCLERVGLPVMVLLRPRAGNFCYSHDELAILGREVEYCKRAGAAGVVLGVLTAEQQIDEVALRTLVERARPLSVTFHRAFDLVPNAQIALEALLRCGVDRLLTAGGRASAWEGRAGIRQCVEQAAGRLTVIAGGGVRPEHLRELVQDCGVREVHASGQRLVRPRHHAPRSLSLLASELPDENCHYEPDESRLLGLCGELTRLRDTLLA